ncbi:alpha/beta fold hydrolase [Sphingomonas daechungensis]|uniref:alpha/beta fold hydrolase n=1 Tax=Sphingomonas daechungensis TaxID=1176646 RepID=UPI0031E9CC5C
MDVLTDILASLRLTGGVVIDAQTRGDFCLLSRFKDEDSERFQVRADELVAYHYIRSGRLYASVDGEPPITLNPGDIVLLPRNDVHLLYTRPGLTPIDSHEVIEAAPNGPARVLIDNGGDAVDFYCGFLGVSTENHPLLDSLPKMLKLDSSDDAHSDWIETSMRMLNEAGQSPEMVARVSELFFAEAIRRYMDRLPRGERGWLAGLKDPAVAKALAVIHSRYAEELDIETLAREAGVSRTKLGELFAELIGEPPMRYCGRWRMRVAANMLRDGKQNASNVAYSVGFNSEAAFTRAFKREYGEPPATWRRRVEDDAKKRVELAQTGLPQQVVRYARAEDGTRLAFSIMGEGPPLVKAANWLNHLEHDWKSPVWRHWLHEFARGHSLIRYDERANGMSDWDTPEISFEAFVDDLECVVEQAGVDKFDLLGISQGASVAIAYAVRHPERVRRLLICGGYAAGWAARGDPEEIARREALLTLTEVGWGADHPTYRQVFTSLYIPNGTPEQINWWNEMQKVSCSPENAVKLQRALSLIDVRDLLPQVSVPTLIFHSRDDQVVPFSAGEYLARNIPEATFVPLDGDNHLLLEKEAGWNDFVRLARQFLKPEEGDELDPLVAEAKPAEQSGTCASSDGAKIAWTSIGEGFPLVMPAVWFHHIDKDLSTPTWSHWMAEGLRGRRLIRSDMRGVGLSDPDPHRWNFDSLLDDFVAVIDGAGVEKLDVLGMSHGALVAIAYAARFPERVRRLVLIGGYAEGFGVRNDPEEIMRRETLLNLGRGYAPSDRGSFARMLGALYWPEANSEMMDWFVDRLGTISVLSEQLQDVFRTIDLRPDLAKIQAPTLIMHSRGDRIIPSACSETMAAQIAGSKLVLLDSENHIPLDHDKGWTRARAALRAFLGEKKRVFA